MLKRTQKEIREQLYEDEKRKRKLRESLRAKGYGKMWAKIEMGPLGSTAVDIFDGKLYLKVEGSLIETRKA